MKLFNFLRPNGSRPRGPYNTWPLLPDSVAQEYESGSALLTIAAAHKTSLHQVRQKLVSLGVTIRSAGTYSGMPHESARKLTHEQMDWIFAQDDLNVSHSDIAKQVNVTRERIRQICKISGRASRRSRMTKGVEKQEISEVKQRDRTTFINHLSERWKAGANLAELQQLTGLNTDQKVASRIASLRQRYPDLFPLRIRRNTDEAELNEMNALWNRGATIGELAERFGYHSPSSMSVSITYWRSKDSKWFPRRQANLGSGITTS